MNGSMDEFERLKRSLAIGGGVLLALVLITEVYIWVNLWRGRRAVGP
jgi:hypothetical protein